MSAFDFAAGPRPAAFVPTTYGDPPEVAHQGRTSAIIYALYGGGVGVTPTSPSQRSSGSDAPCTKGRHL